MKRTVLKCLTTLVIMTLVLSSCKRTDLSKISSGALSPELAVPIGQAKFTVIDVLASKDSTNLITVDGQGALKLVYETELEILDVSDLTQLDDKTVDFDHTALEYGIGPSPGFFGSATVMVDETFDFNSQNGEKLYSIEFLDGKLIVTVSTNVQHNVSFDLTFPDFIVSGSPAQMSLDLTNPQVGQFQTAKDSVDLTNAEFQLDNGAQGFNEFQIAGTVTITGTGAPITGAESIDFSIGMKNLDFDVIYADFGQQAIQNYRDTIELKVFNNFFGGTIEFTNPTINFEVINTFGLPLRMDINEIKTVENSGNENSLISSALNLNVPASPSQGTQAVGSLTLDASNTQNLGSIISPAPKKLVFDLGGAINPAGPATNFVSHNSALSVRADVDLPLEGYATGFSLRDTIDFKLVLPPLVEEAMIRLIIDNGFPIELGSKLYIADENYTILADLTPETNIITGAPVNANGRVTNKAKKITDIILTDTEVELLNQTKYLIIEASGQTTDGNQGEVVKFYNDYEIVVKLAAQVKGSL